MLRGFRENGAFHNVRRSEAPLRQRQVRLRVIRIAFCERFGSDDGCGQFRDSAAAHGDRGDDGYLEGLGQGGRIERQPVPLGEIDHVQRDHRGPAERDNFLCEHQMLFEVGGIENHNEHFGRSFAWKFAVDDLPGNFLVRARRFERIGTRQVDQLDRLAARQDQPPRLTLDSHARIVGDLLPRAGERIE